MARASFSTGGTRERLAAAAERLAATGAHVDTLPFDVTDHCPPPAPPSIATRRRRGRSTSSSTTRGMQHPRPSGGLRGGGVRAADAHQRVERLQRSAMAVARHMIAPRGKAGSSTSPPSSPRSHGGDRALHGLERAPSPIPHERGWRTDWAPPRAQRERHRARLLRLRPLNAALVADPAFSAWLEKRTPQGAAGGACRSSSAPASSLRLRSVELRERSRPLYVDGGNHKRASEDRYAARLAPLPRASRRRRRPPPGSAGIRDGATERSCSGRRQSASTGGGGGQDRSRHAAENERPPCPLGPRAGRKTTAEVVPDEAVALARGGRMSVPPGGGILRRLQHIHKTRRGSAGFIPGA